MAKCLSVSVVCPVLSKQPKTKWKCQLIRSSWLEVALSLHDEIQINLVYVFFILSHIYTTDVGVPLEYGYQIRLLIVICLKSKSEVFICNIVSNP
jgi:hypothetical protein